MALLQARAGISRAGAYRANYFTTNLVVLLSGTDITTKIVADSLSVDEGINNEPKTATFTILPNSGLTITEGNRVIVSLGSASNREFSGEVLRLSTVYRPGVPNPWLEIYAIDDSRPLLEKRLVNAEYVNQTVDQIATDLILNNATGVTFGSVAKGLGTIAHFVVTNETVRSALTRLTNIIQGGWYLDQYDDVHVFGPSGDASPRAGTNPITLVSGLWSLMDRGIRITKDASQWRTRVRVEGQQTTTLISVSANTDTTNYPSQTLPIAGDKSPFTSSRVRIGANILSIDGVNGPDLTGGKNPRGSTVSADAAAGAGSISVADISQFDPHGWVQVGEQVVYYDAVGATFLATIPSSGYGAIAAAIKSGTQVTQVSYVIFTAGQTIVNAIPVGTTLISLTQVEDTSAETTIATAEGRGDGIYEHVVSDGRLNGSGQLSRANAELGLFKLTLQDADWTTRDLNARSGRRQTFNLTGFTPTLQIIKSTTTYPNQFPGSYQLPLRTCEVSSAKSASMLDAMITGNG